MFHVTCLSCGRALGAASPPFPAGRSGTQPAHTLEGWGWTAGQPSTPPTSLGEDQWEDTRQEGRVKHEARRTSKYYFHLTHWFSLPRSTFYLQNKIHWILFPKGCTEIGHLLVVMPSSRVIRVCVQASHESWASQINGITLGMFELEWLTMISMADQREVPQYMDMPWLMTCVMALTISVGDRECVCSVFRFQ